MTTQAQIGWGTLFQTADTGSPSGWATLAETRSLNLPPIERDAISAAHEAMPNQYKEYLVGLKDGGEVSVALNFTFTSYQTLLNEFSSTTIKQRRIVFPNGSTYVFNAWLTGIDTPIAVGDLISTTAKFKVSGQPGPLTIV